MKVLQKQGILLCTGKQFLGHTDMLVCKIHDFPHDEHSLLLSSGIQEALASVCSLTVSGDCQTLMAANFSLVYFLVLYVQNNFSEGTINEIKYTCNICCQLSMLTSCL